MKLIVRVDLHDDKDKLKVMKRVCYISGVHSISMDMKDKKLTVIGDIDPASVVHKLRRTWDTRTIFVGPAEPEKKEEPGKKVERKLGGTREHAQKEVKKRHVSHPVPYYQPYAPSYQVHYPSVPYYYARSMEEDPNACVIC